MLFKYLFRIFLHKIPPYTRICVGIHLPLVCSYLHYRGCLGKDSLRKKRLFHDEIAV